METPPLILIFVGNCYNHLDKAIVLPKFTENLCGEFGNLGHEKFMTDGMMDAMTEYVPSHDANGYIIKG